MRVLITIFLLLFIKSTGESQDLASVGSNYIASVANTTTTRKITAADYADKKRLHTTIASHQVQDYLSTHVSYNDLLQENGIEGRIVVEFAINERGSINGKTILESNSDFLAKQVTTALKDLKVVPLDGQSYYGARKIRVPIDFKL